MTAREFTFAMIDLAGYTALAEHHGDDQAADLAVAFTDVARSCLLRDERLIKSIGDAVLLAVPGPQEGIALVGRVLATVSTVENFPLTRTGLHHGEAVERGDDLFGTSVNLTARIAAQAQGGQVLATATIAAAARELGFATAPQGTAQLKNLCDPYELFSLDLGPVRQPGSVDPVCKMWVERKAAVGPETHGGRDYGFCSTDCANAFRAAPERFTGH